MSSQTVTVQLQKYISATISYKYFLHMQPGYMSLNAWVQMGLKEDKHFTKEEGNKKLQAKKNHKPRN